MVLRTALLCLLALALPAEAASRGDRIAMAVALLEVAKERCPALEVDEDLHEHLIRHFREYDIGGIASAISGPLNTFYEDFQFRARRDARDFCQKAPQLARSTGYPVILRAQ